MKLGPVWYSR